MEPFTFLRVLAVDKHFLLLLCSTQPNSQMASTMGEEEGGGGVRI